MKSAQPKWIPGRRAAKRLLLLGAAAPFLGCGTTPDQGAFAALSSLPENGLAIARLYAAPLPGIGLVAIHPWFVVKQAESTSFDRWEVWPVAGEPFGHVRENLFAAEGDASSDRSYVIAELQGAAAEPVVDFIYSQSPSYPCRDHYALLPGPNSSSYAQWVLDGTGWNAALPPSAIGKDVACSGPAKPNSNMRQS